MVQGTEITHRTRLKLISLLPRLRRFAAVLAGDREGGDALLRAASRRMLHADAVQRGSAPFDIWAYSELYGLWLEKLRDHTDPMTQGRGDGELFREVFAGGDLDEDEAALTAEILSGLPPQQRSAVLLVYGDGFSYEDAAIILDAARHRVVERVTRALTTIIDRTGPVQGGHGAGAVVQSLYPAERQAI